MRFLEGSHIPASPIQIHTIKTLLCEDMPTSYRWYLINTWMKNYFILSSSSHRFSSPRTDYLSWCKEGVCGSSAVFEIARVIPQEATLHSYKYTNEYTSSASLQMHTLKLSIIHTMYTKIDRPTRYHAISCSCARTLFIYWIVSQSTIFWLFRATQNGM